MSLSLPAVLASILLYLSPACVHAAASAQQNASPTSTESPEMDLLAARIAEKLVKTRIKITAIRRFHGRKTDSQAIGLKLSEQLSLALTRNKAGIQVFDHSRLISALEDKKWMAIDADDHAVFNSIANAVGVQAAIGGSYKISAEFIELEITIRNTGDDKKIAEFKVQLRASGTTTTPTDTLVRDPLTQVYLPTGGVTSPQCKDCPEPEFSPEAREKRVSKAQSLIRITVLADGRAADIRIIKPAGYGLDENAVQAIQTWQFIPGHLPKGTAVATRVTAEVTFERR